MNYMDELRGMKPGEMKQLDPAGHCKVDKRMGKVTSDGWAIRYWEVGDNRYYQYINSIVDIDRLLKPTPHVNMERIIRRYAKDNGLTVRYMNGCAEFSLPG